MAPSKGGETSSWLSTRNVRLSRGSPPIKLDKGLLSKRSAKVYSLLESNPQEDLTLFFVDIQANPETLELVARFCHGFDIMMTTDNIIPLICLSHHLEMTESHSPNNLLQTSLSFFKHQILPSWDHTIRSLRAAATGPTLQKVADIGLLDHCLDSLSAQALSDPTLVAKPNTDPQKANNKTTTNARRKLFGSFDDRTSMSACTEDLTSLPPQVYELVIETMARRGVPQDSICGSLSRYLNRHESNSLSEAVEAIERLLPGPTDKHCHFIPIPFLYEAYNVAVSSGAGPTCKSGLEARIGSLLERARVQDLLALDLDVESLKQMLKGYYGNFTDDRDSTGLETVAKLMEGYLAEVAREGEIEIGTFFEVATLVASVGIGGSCTDGLYKAVCVYLESHRELTEKEREEVCRVLDFQRMSSQAVNHAAMNQRLPLRVVVQALFVSQLHLRDDVVKAAGQFCSNSIIAEEDGGGERDEEDERREMVGGGCERSCCGEKCKKKKKVSLWKEVKRKFGCMGSNSSYVTMHDCSCQAKKRKKFHPK